MRLCESCGGVFTPKDQPGKKPQRYCCGPCRNAGNSRSTADQRSQKLRGRGSGKSYPKFHGRHLHRVVAEQMLGRPLMPGEIVHHENRNKQDASPDNLNVLPSQAAHASIHSKKNKTCDICERKHSAKGLCKYHYNKRWFAAHPGYIQSRNHSKKGGDAQ